jgi:hypothetical protein
VAVGQAHPKALSPGRASVGPGHLGRGPGLIDEDEPRRIEFELPLEPGFAPAQDVGPGLFVGVPGLFLSV